MAFQATLIYSERLAKQAVLQFWWRTTGIGFFIALAIAASGFAMQIARGDSSWTVGVLGSALAIGLCIPALFFVIHYRFALSKLKAMGKPEATLTVTDDSISFASGAGSATLPWSAISHVIQSQDFWLLMYSKSQFSTLPLENLSPEFRSFILERSRAAGAKID
jgi:hypothetical protein